MTRGNTTQSLTCTVFRYVGTEVRNIYNSNVNNTLPIWLDDIQCTGSEKHIGDCSHSPWGINNCVHREDVAVSCYCKALHTLTVQKCY